MSSAWMFVGLFIACIISLAMFIGGLLWLRDYIKDKRENRK